MEIRILIYVTLLVNFVVIVETVKPCSTADQLPVVNICTRETRLQDASNTVLIKADSTQNCTCELSIINQDQAVSVNIQKFGQEISSSPTHYGCGLILHFREVLHFENNLFWIANCIVRNTPITRSINQGKVLTIKSWTVSGNLKKNEGYCIEIEKTNNTTRGNELNLTCGIDSTTTTTTIQSGEATTNITPTTKPTKSTTNITPTTKPTKSTTRTTTTTVTTKTTVPEITTAAATTTTVIKTSTTISTTTQIGTDEFTGTDGYVSTKQANQLIIKDNDDIITIVVGASVGGLVIIIVVIIMVCIYRRNYQKSTCKPGPTFDTNNDHYGLHDNVLYVSSESSDTTQTLKNADIPITNRISVDIDGNYSTIDLNEKPSIEESTGDYSSKDMVKLTPTVSNMNRFSNEKPIIAPKPKQNDTIKDDVYSVPDKNRLKHVTATGEGGCEYAVVSKPNKANVDKSEDQASPSIVYAVVEKKKHMSDGKGTNQKRDSSTAENDS